MRGEVAFSLRQMAFGVSPHASIMRQMVFVSCLIRKKLCRKVQYRAPCRCMCMCVVVALLYHHFLCSAVGVANEIAIIS